MSEEHRGDARRPDPAREPGTGAEDGPRTEPADEPGSPGSEAGDPTADTGAVTGPDTGAGTGPGADADVPAGTPGDAPDDAEPSEPTGPPRLSVVAESDEQALRRLMQEAVRDIEPAPTSLEHLQRAVPVRRRRKLHALVGAVAVCVLLGVSLPLMLGNGMVPGLSDRSTTTANSSQPGVPEEDQPTLNVASPSTSEPEPDGDPDPGTSSGPSADSSPTGGNDSEPDDPNETLVGVSPSCASEQLGDGGATTESPDEQGRVYGTFRVTNVSGDSCTVSDPGLMAANAENESRAPGTVQVLDHTGGVSAMGLPAPEEGRDKLILKPGEVYEVRFAWVPQPGGGVTGCERNTTGQTAGGAESAQPKGDTDGATDGGGGSGGGEEGAAGNTGGDSGDAAPKPSVVLDYTPGTGGPHSQLTLENACAGTVYRTGMLPAG